MINSLLLLATVALGQLGNDDGMSIDVNFELQWDMNNVSRSQTSFFEYPIGEKVNPRGPKRKQ